MELLVAAANIHYGTGGNMLKVHVKKSDAVEVLCLEGQIVNGDTDTLRTIVQSAPTTSDIILDLSNVSVVDAHGLGVLLQLREQTIARGAHFELMNVRDSLYKIFEITRLNTVFKISPNIQLVPAVASWQRVLLAA